MATLCEGCGQENPKRYERGPFMGQRMELDYCTACSENLCDNCMKNSPCEDNFGDSHDPASEQEDEDE